MYASTTAAAAAATASYGRYHRNGTADDAQLPRSADAADVERPRQRRYARSSTTSSVAQLLSDGCTNLLQKLTTRVRGPSTAVDRATNTPRRHHHHRRHDTNDDGYVALAHSKSSTVVPATDVAAGMGSTRTRLEDKYANVLDRIYGRSGAREYHHHEDDDEEEEKSRATTACPLSKSATTGNVVVLAEKAYPYVVSGVTGREKTPYRKTQYHRRHDDHANNNHLVHHHHQQHFPGCRQQYGEPAYSYVDRVRHKSTTTPSGGAGGGELRPRRSSRPLASRSGKSEAPRLKLCPVEIALGGGGDEAHAHAQLRQPQPSSLPDVVQSERDAKRKEIQSLIMKYSALDDFYNRTHATTTTTTDAKKTTGAEDAGGVVGGGRCHHVTTAKPQQHLSKAISDGDPAKAYSMPKQSVALTLAQKYYPNGGAGVAGRTKSSGSRRPLAVTAVRFVQCGADDCVWFFSFPICVFGPFCRGGIA